MAPMVLLALFLLATSAAPATACHYLSSGEQVLASNDYCKETADPSSCAMDWERPGLCGPAGFPVCCVGRYSIVLWYPRGHTCSGEMHACSQGYAGQPVTSPSFRGASNQGIAGEDQHGCLASAGYEWCAALEACVRPFETPCVMDVPAVAAAPVSPEVSPPMRWGGCCEALTPACMACAEGLSVEAWMAKHTPKQQYESSVSDH